MSQKGINTRPFILIVLLVLLGGVNSYGMEQDPGAADFWHRFQKAVVQKDYARICSMTKFPFEVRGPDDADPVKYYDRKACPAVIQKVLDQPVSLLSQGMIITLTMAEAIHAKKEVVGADYRTPNMIRVHQLVFRRIDGKWLLTRAYLEEF